MTRNWPTVVTFPRSNNRIAIPPAPRVRVGDKVKHQRTGRIGAVVGLHARAGCAPQSAVVDFNGVRKAVALVVLTVLR